MGQIIVQVYYCCSCHKIYEVQEFGMHFPKCPFCGNGSPIHRGQRTIEVD